MLRNTHDVKQCWNEVSALLERWLSERKALLVHFCTVSELQSSSTNTTDIINPQQKNFQGFCEVLVDYVSAGHFEIYEQLLQESALFRDGHVEMVERLYTVIAKTTAIVLNFHDKCMSLKPKSDLTHDLSVLGLALETRFAAEDYLIDVLHNAHKPAIS